LGRENVATPALQDLIEDPFSRADLYGKLANIHADLPAIRLKHTGIFKMLTGQDLIWANVKHKKPFTFRNYAKLLYSANELPATNDTSEAFWRRWLLITFPNTFPDGDPKTDPNILSKLTTPEELSGMLNWALEGLRRLLKQGHFTYTKTQSEVEEEWVARTDSLRAFVKKYARKSTGHYVTKESFYAAYSAFCEENESTPIEKAAVGRRLPTLLPGITEFHPAEENKQKRAWKGIALLPPYDIYHKQAAITEITLFSRETDITDMTEKKYMETNSNKKDNIYNNQKNTVISVILVKVLADIPYTIAGVDGKTYGPFRAGDVVEIPRENALLLAHRGLVEILDQGDRR
jgi:phage/plasmid-associated DNA primase